MTNSKILLIVDTYLLTNQKFFEVLIDLTDHRCIQL